MLKPILSKSQETDENACLIYKKEPLIDWLHRIIQLAVRALAILMTFVILWGVADVVWIIYQRLIQPPFLLLRMGDILETFGAFLAVLIAIEIFMNITFYLRDDAIHVQLVLATALMAIARKVIIFDFEKIEPGYIWATAFVILALSLGYWLVMREDSLREIGGRRVESRGRRIGEKA